MDILLTNDDGITAPGILALYRALRGLGRVTVVAPDRERSATGHAITVHEPLQVVEVILNGEEERGWAVSGTPSDCVKLALKALLPKAPDLVVSGINHGPNLGTDVLYSGTVSAAIEGILNGVPAVAFSLATFSKTCFQGAGQVAYDIITQMRAQELPPRTLLNVNIPPVAYSQYRGIKVTRLGFREYENIFEERKDPRGNSYYWLGGDIVDHGQDADDIDIGAVKKNYVSITPVHFDLTNYNIMTEVKTWDFTLREGDRGREDKL